MFSTIGKTKDKFIVNETHLANFNSQEKKSHMNCVSMLNSMSFFEIMLFSTFLKAKDNVFNVYSWSKKSIFTFFKK